MSGFPPLILPVPPPVRYVTTYGCETEYSKQLTAQWRIKNEEIAEENKERTRHNLMLFEIE